MKKVLFLFLVALGYWASYGQCTGNGCQNINIQNAAPWSESHGTPSWGNNSVWLWSYAINGNASGEGVNYSGTNFVQGQQYCVSFTLAATTNTGNIPNNNVSMNVILTPNAVLGNTGTNTNNPVPNTPNPNQVIMNQNIWANGNNTQTYTFNFTANQNFNNIWFFPQNPNAPNPQIEVRITNLVICNNCDTTDSPAFDIDISCDNGNKCVTVTSNDPDITNHWWGLMEIADYSQPNNTSDANTVDADGNAGNGITPVQLITGTNSATFCGLDLSKRYYIKHGIWNPGCYNWREARTPVPNFDAESIFHFEDDNGNIKTDFCYGEDVFLNGTASYGESNYYIDIWRRPAGSTGPFNWYDGLGWSNGQVGVLNLSALFANELEPGYEYEVKVAISNTAECIGWTPTTHTFTVKCCEDFFDASFHSQQSTFGNITILSYNGYANINATHEWFVVSSPNPTGGPYTAVTSLTYNGPAPFNITMNSQPGLYYTVIHRITTDCGEVCDANVHYFDRSSNGAPLSNRGGELDNPCELIDIVFPPCDELTAPTNLQVVGTTLTWDPVPGATSYIITSPAWNEPQISCECRDQVSLLPISVTTNSYTIPTSLEDKCFIWQVTAVCGDGVESRPSEQMCFYPVRSAQEGTSEKATIIPNPNDGNFTIALDMDYDTDISITVYDFFGQQVKTFADSVMANKQHTIQWDGAGALHQGVYILEIKTDKEVLLKRMIVE